MAKLIYHDRYVAHENGDIQNASTGKVLRPGRNSRGYMTVSLYDGSTPKKAKSFLVHRLVAEAYLGESDLQINHKDGNKENNAISNLEYVTAKENSHHAIKTLGKTQVGECNSNAKLTAEQVEEIRKSPDKNSVIAKRLGMNRDYVRTIRRGLYWKNESATGAS